MIKRTIPFWLLLLVTLSPLLHGQEEDSAKDLPSLNELIQQVDRRSSDLQQLTCKGRVETAGEGARRRWHQTRPTSHIRYRRGDFFLNTTSVGLNGLENKHRPAVYSEVFAPEGKGIWRKMVMLHSRANYMQIQHQSLKKKQSDPGGAGMMLVYLRVGMPGGRAANLMAIHLRPDILRSHKGTTTISRETVDGTPYHVIEQKIDTSFSYRSFTINRKFYLNPKNSRIERLRVQGRGNLAFVAEVRSWKKVAGTSVPETIRIQDGDAKRSVTIRYHDVQTAPDAVRMRRPSWAGDPALASSAPPRDPDQLKKRIRTGKAGPTAYLRYASEFIENNLRGLIKGEAKGVKDLKKRIQDGIRAHPSSGLLREQLALLHIQTGGHPKVNKLLGRWRKKGQLTPLLRYVRARKLASAGSFREANDWSRELRDHPQFDAFARGVKMRTDLHEDVTVDAFLDGIERVLSSDDPSVNLRALSILEPPLIEEREAGGVLARKETDFLNAVAKKTDRASVRVLAARGLARSDQREDALALFNKAGDTIELKLERKVLVLRMEEEGESESVPIENTVNLKVLHRHAINAIKNKEKERERKALKRIRTVLKGSSRSDAHELFDGEGAEDGELVEKLVDQLIKTNRPDQAKRYLKTFRDNPDLQQYLIRNDHSLKAIKKVFQSDQTELYKFARLNEHEYYREQLMEPDKLERLLKRRIRKGKADVRDYVLVTYKMASDRELVPEGKPGSGSRRLKRYVDWLEQGIEAHPEQVKMIERRADALFMMGKYKDAAIGYRRTMDVNDQNGENSSHTIHVNLSFGRNEAGEEVELDDSPLIKMAFAYKKMDHPEVGRSEIMKRLKSSEDRKTRKLAARGLQLLGYTDAAISLMRTWFKELQEKDRKWFEGLVQVSQALRLMHYLQEGGQHHEVLFVGKRVRKHLDQAQNRGFDHYVEKVKKFMKTSRETMDMKALRRDVLDRSFPEPEPGVKKNVTTLIKQLSARAYSKRQAAFRKLKKLGLAAAPQLKKHADTSNPEVRNRIHQLMNYLARSVRREQLRKLYSTSSDKAD